MEKPKYYKYTQFYVYKGDKKKEYLTTLKESSRICKLLNGRGDCVKCQKCIIIHTDYAE